MPSQKNGPKIHTRKWASRNRIGSKKPVAMKPHVQGEKGQESTARSVQRYQNHVYTAVKGKEREQGRSTQRSLQPVLEGARNLPSKTRGRSNAMSTQRQGTNISAQHMYDERRMATRQQMSKTGRVSQGDATMPP